MILSVHYRSVSDFSDQGIERAVSGLARAYSAMAQAERVQQFLWRFSVSAAGGAQRPQAGKVAPGLIGSYDDRLTEAWQWRWTMTSTLLRLLPKCST
jgi:hypothetical protein